MHGNESRALCEWTRDGTSWKSKVAWDGFRCSFQTGMWLLLYSAVFYPPVASKGVRCHDHASSQQSQWPPRLMQPCKRRVAMNPSHACSCHAIPAPITTAISRPFEKQNKANLRCMCNKRVHCKPWLGVGSNWMRSHAESSTPRSCRPIRSNKQRPRILSCPMFLPRALLSLCFNRTASFRLVFVAIRASAAHEKKLRVQHRIWLCAWPFRRVRRRLGSEAGASASPAARGGGCCCTA